MRTLFRTLATTAVIGGLTLTGVGIANADPAETRDPSITIDESSPTTPDGFDSMLEAKATKSADAKKSLKQFRRLSELKKRRLIQILQDPRFVSEFLDTAGEFDGTEQSEVFPGEVIYEEIEAVTDSSISVDTSSHSSNSTSQMSSALAPAKALAFTPANYAANSSATGTASSSCIVLGVNITTLKIWVTFKTGNQRIPKSILSYGSGASNVNFFVNVSATNNPAYIESSKGLAVATTTWHGYLLVKGLGSSFDKRDTAKFFNGGLYAHTLVNI